MDTGRKKKAADLAAERLREEILRGSLRSGQDLPGERELAERLGVSRLTLRSALTRLEAEGLVRPVHGSGTRVLDFRQSGGVDLIGWLVQLSLSGGEMPDALVVDLLELRRMMAVEVLGLVAERAEPADIRSLREQLPRLAELVDDAPRFMEADLAFARTVVRASRNMALELLYNTVARLITAQTGLEIFFVANARETLAVYARLIDILETGDGERVRKLTRRLMARLDHRTMQRVHELTGAFGGAAGGGSS